ncbi:vascular-related unknown protein 1-like [Prosopis cineraria]|uniref:vascular-related unknown protein 1-like n=1 Tax=Prosopis cineraria TaxID=364024 RepID=UPI00240F9636|nr:vascular-related unknown protein 1-like [Prosopis cineraria]
MAKPASSSKKDLIVRADHEDQEESGWTSYFEDLSSNTGSSCFSLCSGGSSSLVSDAASCAACKFSHHHNHRLLSSLSSNNYGVPPNHPDMKLRFKKSRTKKVSHDDDDDPLEDTATSPLNSPKDGDQLDPTVTIPTKTADHLSDDSTGKGFTSEHVSDLKRDHGAHSKDEKNSRGKNSMSYTDLKKRGLSLFPLSMLVNYFG